MFLINSFMYCSTFTFPSMYCIFVVGLVNKFSISVSIFEFVFGLKLSKMSKFSESSSNGGIGSGSFFSSSLSGSGVGSGCSGSGVGSGVDSSFFCSSSSVESRSGSDGSSSD